MMIVLSRAIALIRLRTSCFWFGSRPSVGSSRIQHRLGIVQDGAGESDATLEALRQGIDRLLQHALKVQARDRIVEAPLAKVAFEVTHVRNEFEELVHAHLAVARRAFRQVAHDPLGLQRLLLDVEAADRGAARSRRKEAGEHLHRGRLAGAVRAEEAEHLPRLDLEADAIDGSEAAIAFT